MSLNWNNLTKEEKSAYMKLQTAHGGGVLVEIDWGQRLYECDACGKPIADGGLCHTCYTRWEELHMKLTQPSSKRNNMLTRSPTSLHMRGELGGY